MKSWIPKALQYLEKSLGKVAVELNELDWKETISPNNTKLCQHISAFANMPGGGFIVFGIKNNTKEVLGLSTSEANTIVDKFASLCRDGVEPLVSIDYSIEKYQEKEVLIIYIKESAIKPVFLHGKTLEDSFIRSGGSTRKASRQDVGALMLNSKSPTWEELHASKLLTEIEVIDLLDFSKILELLNKPTPANLQEIMKWLEDEKMLVNADGKGYYITNFGAITAAKDLKHFDGLVRKSIRLIKYEGKNKAGASKEFPGNKGYAIGFEALITFVKGLLDDSEIIKNALRVDTSIYPEIAIRELIANTLIHQDFTIRGSGPMVEIFDDRIVFTNPGKLLPSKKIDRLIRTTPESRNEILAAAFRRYNICEERGSGFEKAVINIELFGLPPLKIEELENSFRVTMYAPKTYAEMTNEERIEAAYQHAVITYFSDGGFNNTSLRERFGMHDKQASQISLLIKEAIEAGKIKPKEDGNVSKKFSKYIPYWA
ncbi:ATP-binding protein [Empedobacter sp. GD03739]|uniref:ATP-binding protein n=1 Tax=Empedobacter sp. GD03739 TaxID=2975376 RepID=UPI00244A44BB|nr:ATP-binding protein [Empedobacter sp. GD03739]MDH1603788.1 putative DNA binding domain-containing protein [Empedobacter sp. GD03739]